MSTPAAPPPSQAKPPSIESPSVGVRRMVIDVESKGPIDAVLDISPEVSMFGLVWAPRFMVMSAAGRCVWELRALREDKRPPSPEPDEDIPFGEEEIDLRGCQTWSPS